MSSDDSVTVTSLLGGLGFRVKGHPDYPST